MWPSRVRFVLHFRASCVARYRLVVKAYFSFVPFTVNNNMYLLIKLQDIVNLFHVFATFTKRSIYLQQKIRFIQITTEKGY